MKNETETIYNQIENKILNHEIYQNVKDYSKAKEKMKTYLEIGELISSIDTKYGKSIIKEYSNRLITKFGKRYSVSLLYKIKQFYLIIQKVPTLSGKLTWSHWYEMLSIDDINKIKEPFYTTKKNGTGLGVSLSCEIIEAHKGTILYRSKVGVGTKVIVTLPILKEFN